MSEIVRPNAEMLRLRDMLYAAGIATDTDATRGRRRVADPLREFANRHADKLGAAIVGDSATADNSAWHYLYKLADQIDREHARRMEQQSYDLRRAFCRYLGGVIDDYKRGIKRKRLRK